MRSAAHVSAAALRKSWRSLHASALVRSAEHPGPVESKLRKTLAAFKIPDEIDVSVVKPGPDGKKQYSAKIKRLADEISNLTLLESIDLTAVLKETLNISQRLGRDNRCIHRFP
jgi:hypothetical protein